MDEPICPVCDLNELMSEQELIDSMCSACLVDDLSTESFGEQDFDEVLLAVWQDDGGEQ